MKKVTIQLCFLISLGVMSFVLMTTAKGTMLTNEQALLLGESKYLKFLWIVDGAFNNERFNEDFIVNGKKLDNKDIVFTCKYNKTNVCIGNNFKEEFNNLFSKNIKYDDVYSDGITYSWYRYEDNKDIFNNMDSCNVNRMNLEHSLKVIKINKDVVFYEVSFDDSKHVKEFNLVLEGNEWKISKAFYHDLCELRYNIG